MSHKKYPIHIIHLPLIPTSTLARKAGVPIGSSEDRHDGWNGSHFVSVGFDADAGVVADGEEIVDYFETVCAGWEVDATDVHYAFELGVCVVFEEFHDGRDCGGGDH